MGTINNPGIAPPEEAITIAKEFDIDLSTHTSNSMDAKELMKSDYIFVMDRTHLEYVKNFFPMVMDSWFSLSSPHYYCVSGLLLGC